jgi:hypothetical protein
MQTVEDRANYIAPWSAAHYTGRIGQTPERSDDEKKADGINEKCPCGAERTDERPAGPGATSVAI